MPHYTIRHATIVDGSGRPGYQADLTIVDDRIAEIGNLPANSGSREIDARGLVLAPGFIDTHTHDDLAVIHQPEMVSKISQGVTTVVVGNCGISASPVGSKNVLPDPMVLLGTPEQFRYRTFPEYVVAVEAAHPAVNVAALIGHTTLRGNQMPDLNRAANPEEIRGMRQELADSLNAGAFGLSSGLAYLSAFSATTEEVIELSNVLGEYGGLYATHLRSETAEIISALEEAFAIGKQAAVPVIVSHLKCAGVDNWGRSEEVLDRLELASADQSVGWDCYPYAAGSSTLDLRQVDPRVKIQITWSQPHPEVAGNTLERIAADWGLPQTEAAKRLQPAGAIYHSISEEDMRTILRHPKTMIGSDGLPCDPLPHPRLWGTFPRILGRYCREHQLVSLSEAIRKMTSLSAERFRLDRRGRIQTGHFADLVLFDPNTVSDVGNFENPAQPAEGILTVWVNGAIAYESGAVQNRNGRFLRNQKNPIA